MKLKAFYGSKISPHMTKTPEGFLVCHSVPIARTGTQDYLGQEIGRTDLYDQTVTVVRLPEEVFHPAAIASFEGKSVTNNHPPEEVKADNNAAYDKGDVTNVRQGTGAESDFLLADLIIKDPNLISEIENGKREISCGYTCEYEKMDDGQFAQRQIRGNHVAIVDKGRAGGRVAIKDSKPNERRKDMTIDPKQLFGKMLKAFAKDAEPEELAAASAMMTKDEEPEEKKEPEKKEVKDEEPMPSWAVEIIKRLEALEKSDEKVHAQLPQDADPLENLKKELSEKPTEEGKPVTDAEGEESVTIEPEAIKEETAPTQIADSKKIALDAIEAAKPIVAAIKDPVERKLVADAMAKQIRTLMGQPVKTTDNGYVKALKPKKLATDSQNDMTDFGRKCAERNPHLKKKEMK